MKGEKTKVSLVGSKLVDNLGSQKKVIPLKITNCETDPHKAQVSSIGKVILRVYPSWRIP